eukprot:RCo044766
MPGYNNINRNKSWDTRRWQNCQKVARAEMQRNQELHHVAEMKLQLAHERFLGECAPSTGLEWMRPPNAVAPAEPEKPQSSADQGPPPGVESAAVAIPKAEGLQPDHAEEAPAKGHASRSPSPSGSSRSSRSSSSRSSGSRPRHRRHRHHRHHGHHRKRRRSRSRSHSRSPELAHAEDLRRRAQAKLERKLRQKAAFAEALARMLEASEGL